MNGGIKLCRACCLQLNRNIFFQSRLYLHTHYDTLGVKTTASQAEIKTAFVRLSKQLHPDLNPDDPKTHDKFVKLNEAYTVLSKPITRREYDLSIVTPGQSFRNQPFYNHPQQYGQRSQAQARRPQYPYNQRNDYEEIYKEYYRQHQFRRRSEYDDRNRTYYREREFRWGPATGRQFNDRESLKEFQKRQQEAAKGFIWIIIAATFAMSGITLYFSTVYRLRVLEPAIKNRNRTILQDVEREKERLRRKGDMDLDIENMDTRFRSRKSSKIGDEDLSTFDR